MNCPNRVNLHLRQGTTFNQRIRYSADGEPVDITEYAVKMQVRKTYATKVVLDLTLGAGLTVSDTNAIDIDITAQQSAAVPAGRYLYDLEISSGSYVERIMQGIFTVDAEVTR